MSDQNYARTDALVSVQWVADHLEDSNVRIVESNEDPLLYSSGHVPGGSAHRLGNRSQRSSSARLP